MSLHLVPRALQYFEEVAQRGSIQAASRELGISASAIHRQITAIEDALGELLFERESKGMTLTPAGLLILELARDWRLDNARLWSVIQADRGVEQGQITIAAMDGMVNGFVPNLVSAIAQRFPRIQVSIEITNPDRALKGVLEGDFDIAAVVNIMPHESLKLHWERNFRLGCIAAPSHAVASQTSIELRELVTHPVAFQNASLSIRKLLEAKHGWIFEQAKKSTVVNSIQLMKQLVLSGQYVAVTSELDADPEIQSGQLRFVPISDEDLFKQKFVLISNLLIPETSAIKEITALAVEILERLPNP